jgi:hypothetical protein
MIKAYYNGAVIAHSVQGLGYSLDDRGSRVPFPAGAGNFSLHHRVQNDSGAQPVSYAMGTRGSFPGGEAAGALSLGRSRSYSTLSITVVDASTFSPKGFVMFETTFTRPTLPVVFFFIVPQY